MKMLIATVALVIATASPPARAHDLQVGTVPICDTQKQMERFVALFDGDTETAISAVNSEENNPTACGVVTVAYLGGPQLAMARSGDNAFEIVSILVVGVSTPTGFQAVEPAKYFSLVEIDERRA